MEPIREKSGHQEITEATQTKIRTIKIVSTILSFIAVGIFLSHIFIEVHDSATVEARKIHKAAKNDKNLAASQLLTYIDQLNSNEITKEEFSSLTIPLSANHKELTKVSAAKFKILTKAKSDAKVLNFNNLNVFTFIFGVFSILLILSILFYIYAKPTASEYKTLIATHKKVTVLFMTISLYYFTYTFYPHSDLPRYLHLTAMVLIGFVLSVTVMSVIDWKIQRKSILQTYKENFQSLFYFIVNKAPAFVAENKMTEYTEGYMEEVEKFKIPENE